MEKDHDDRLSVYEIGYLITASVGEEGVSAQADAVRKIVNDAGASTISEEAPHRVRLAYTIRRKTVAGSYEKHDDAYFGWIKFELGSDKVEAVKKSIEILPSVLRMLLTTTVRENTFLGKRAPAMIMPRAPLTAAVDKKDVPPASVEEMDKSIDEMVKEA
jgi:ribosomal protein S6